MLLTLGIDAAAYSFTGPEFPFAFRFILNITAFLARGINIMCFTFYCEAFFCENTEVNPWVFRVLKIAEAAWIVVAAIEFIAGCIVVSESGIDVSQYPIPEYLQVVLACAMAYIAIAGFFNGRKIGSEAVLLLCAFSVAPIIGILTASVTKYDYTYVYFAVTLVLVAEFIQRNQLHEALESASRESRKNDLLYETVNAGRWSYEIGEDGSVISAEYSSEMRREGGAALSDEPMRYFEAATDLEYEKQILRKDGKAEYFYSSPYYGDKPVWLKCEVHVLSWAGGVPETAVIGITGVDSLRREKLELG